MPLPTRELITRCQRLLALAERRCQEHPHDPQWRQVATDLAAWLPLLIRMREEESHPFRRCGHGRAEGGPGEGQAR